MGGQLEVDKETADHSRTVCVELLPLSGNITGFGYAVHIIWLKECTVHAYIHVTVEWEKAHKRVHSPTQ